MSNTLFCSRISASFRDFQLPSLSARTVSILETFFVSSSISFILARVISPFATLWYFSRYFIVRPLPTSLCPLLHLRGHGRAMWDPASLYAVSGSTILLADVDNVDKLFPTFAFAACFSPSHLSLFTHIFQIFFEYSWCSWKQLLVQLLTNGFSNFRVLI